MPRVTFAQWLAGCSEPGSGRKSGPAGRTSSSEKMSVRCRYVGVQKVRVDNVEWCGSV